MMDKMMYQTALKADVTLIVFEGDKEIFSSKGKWLHPLFELEDFLASYSGSKNDLRIHDTAVGKAAVVIMTRLGIRKIHADIASERARAYVAVLNALPGLYGVELSWVRIVPKLLCATEDILDTMVDTDAMYRLLQDRASASRSRSATAIPRARSFD